VVRPAAIDCYTSFINHPGCILTDKHRQELEHKRGFSEHTIEAGMFRSGRPENADVIFDLIDQYGEPELYERGLLVYDDGDLIPFGQLLDDEIIIPYMGQGGIFHLRPHKLGFPKRVGPIQPFFAGTGHGDPRCVLTEGEFKAAACYQYEIPSVAIPGVSAFGGEHFERLVNLLCSEGVQNPVIMFDNEVKDTPDVGKYIADPMKRWDTQYWAARMARQLIETRRFASVRVAQLPDEWRVDGKIDIDGALAQGRSQQKFAALVTNATDYGQYVRNLPPEGKDIVGKKLRRDHLEKTTVRRGPRGGYEIAHYVEGSDNPTWKSVSDFFLDFEAKVVICTDKDEITMRDVRLSNYLGPAHKLYRANPRSVAKLHDFKTFVLGAGSADYHFEGRQSDLDKVIRLEDCRSSNRTILEPNAVGYLGDDTGIWLFGNGIFKDGHFIPADEKTGAAWNGISGYKAKSSTGLGLGHVDLAVPRPTFENLNGVNLKEIAGLIFKNYGGASRQGYEALTVLCWGLACVYSDDIFKTFDGFPIMYMLGDAQSGKTTLGRWVGNMYGIPKIDSNTDRGTSAGIERTLSLYDNIPVFLDECREEGLEIGNKESLLRSVYDRAPIVKAKGNDSNETRKVIPSAPVMIGGEQKPSDLALNTRCLSVTFKEITDADRQSGIIGSEYVKLQNHYRREVFPKVVPWLLAHGPAAGNFIEEMGKAQDVLRGTPRSRINHSVVLASYALLVDENDELGFCPWLGDKCQDPTDLHVQHKVQDLFFEDLPLLESKGCIKKNVHYRVDPSAATLVLAFRQVYDEWMKDNPSRGKGLPGYNSIKALLMKDPYCQWKSAKVGRSTLRCLLIDLSHEHCPTSLQEWALGIPSESVADSHGQQHF